jgi:hypothetical protein
VTLTQGWEQHPVLSQRDTSKSTLEEQLPTLIQVLEIGKAEAEWTRRGRAPLGHPRGPLERGQQ